MANLLQKTEDEIKESRIEKKSQVVDIGEKYEIMTGNDQVGSLDSRLLPNLHRKWLPSVLDQGPYNSQLYRNSQEQEFYEGFIQPLFRIYKKIQSKKHFDKVDGIQTYQWEKEVSMNALGAERALFETEDGERKSVRLGEVEIILILAVHIMDDITTWKIGKVALRFGCSVDWIRNFKKKIKRAYGSIAERKLEEHLELQLDRCESILDVYMDRAKRGDHYAAKIVKDFMDKEDQYIMPTIEQLPVKDTEENRQIIIDRLAKINQIVSRNKLEDKSKKEV